MKINETNGTLEFNTAELDTKTLEICEKWLRDMLRRDELSSGLEKTKKARAENDLRRHGKRIACDMVAVLREYSTGNARNIEIFNLK